MRMIIMAICLGLGLGLAGAAGAADEVELAFWRSVEDGGTRADYQAYLSRYPNGDFADLARNRLSVKTASTTSSSSPSTTPDGGLTKPERIRAQTALVRLGYDTRGIDGIFGPGTRGAIRNWQEDRGLAVTGFLTRRQYDKLTSEETAKRRNSDIEDWREAKADDTIASYKRYLRRQPDGNHVDKARRRIDKKLDEMGQRGVSQDERREAKLGLTRRQRVEIEDRLDAAGFRPGPTDGEFDRRTRSAIADFRGSEGLPRHGYVDRPMLRRLVAKTGGSRAADPNEDFSDFAAGAAVGALVLGGIVLLAD